MPLSAVGKDAGPGLALGQNLWAIAIAIFCIGSLLGALNFIATTLDLRTKGMTLARMPLCTWAWFVTSVIALLAFAVLLPACILLILDRVAGTSFFIPAGLVLSDRLQPHAGGSVLLWQHLFWFFGHPEVYIAILPSIGIVSHILPAFVRKPLLGHRAAIGCMIAISLPQLHGLGPPHVRQRHESFFGQSFLRADSDHHYPGDDSHAAADRHRLRRQNALHYAGALLPRIYFRVYQRWR